MSISQYLNVLVLQYKPCDNINKNIEKINTLLNNANIIKRPKYLTTNKALGDDAFKHGYQKILLDQNKKGNKIEFIILLFANAATINHKQIISGVNFLRNNPTFDSAVSVSKYNMWSPLRARKVEKDGSLKPFVAFKTFGNHRTLNCDRDSQGDVHYADMSVSIVRPKCLESLNKGLLPQKWMGKKIMPIKSWGGCDVDYKWQIPGVEHWLINNGVKRK